MVGMTVFYLSLMITVSNLLVGGMNIMDIYRMDIWFSISLVRSYGSTYKLALTVIFSSKYLNILTALLII